MWVKHGLVHVYEQGTRNFWSPFLIYPQLLEDSTPRSC